MDNIPPLSQFIQKVGIQINMEFAPPASMHYAIFDNNNGALGFYTSPRKNPRTRHIVVKYNFLRDQVGEGKGIMDKRVESKEHKADVFTKGLPA